jgi:hypothetical protein
MMGIFMPRTTSNHRYNPFMSAALLSEDTAPEAEQVQVDLWRSMSPLQKARLASDLSRGVRELTLVGIRARHPGIGSEEQFLRLAQMTLGTAMTRRVYPNAEELVGA